MQEFNNPIIKEKTLQLCYATGEEQIVCDGVVHRLQRLVDRKRTVARLPAIHRSAAPWISANGLAAVQLCSDSFLPLRHSHPLSDDNITNVEELEDDVSNLGGTLSNCVAPSTSRGDSP